MKDQGKSDILLGLLIGLFWQPIQAEDISLMLTPAQRKSLNGALSAAGNAGSIKPQVLFLQAILYLDDQQWVIWINDQRLDPAGSLEEVEVHQVTHDHILISFAGMVPVTLKVNQSYLSSGQIKEGDHRFKPSTIDKVSSHNNLTDEHD